jgi:hypothetical protein
MTTARPLSRSLRGELEAMFGADFARVRVYESALAAPLACTQGEDIYFAPGAYDPWTRAGREVLGHELAHVLQQRFGRVRCDNGGELEAEAALAGRAIARGEPVRIPGRPGGRPTPATQCYQVVLPAGRAGVGLAVANAQHHAPYQADDTFLGQDKGGAAASPSSFLLAGGAVNISAANPAGVNIRLSANGNMAIEDADLNDRQPKVCYATQAIINASNASLAARGSRFRLVGDPAGPNQQSITVGGQVLLRVTPQNTNNGTAGLAMNAAQSCDTLVEQVIGARYLEPRFTNPLVWTPHLLFEYHVARALLPAPAPAALPTNTDFVAYGNAMRGIAVPYANAARVAAGPFVNLLQHHGLNEYASPQVSEGFVTASLIAAAPGVEVKQTNMPPTYTDHYHHAAGGPIVVRKSRTWGSHWGGVVARDGADVITLENYARTVEDTLASNDTRYYFQMYNTNPPAGGAGSWHHAWTTTPLQAIAAGGAAPPAPHPAPTHEPVSPGAQSFANPITLKVAAPGH